MFWGFFILYIICHFISFVLGLILIICMHCLCTLGNFFFMLVKLFLWSWWPMIFTLVYFVSYEVSFYNFIDYNLCLDYSIEFENWQHIGHGVYKYKIWDSEHYIKCNFLKTSKLDSISILAKPDAVGKTFRIDFVNNQCRMCFDWSRCLTSYIGFYMNQYSIYGFYISLKLMLNMPTFNIANITLNNIDSWTVVVCILELM